MEVANVVQFMIDELNRSKILYQRDIVLQIQDKFGDDFTYINDSGNCAISKKVLQLFKNKRPSNTDWCRGEKCWEIIV
jgi:hypothetical protein